MKPVKIERVETIAVTLPTRPFQTRKRVRAGLGPIRSLDFVFVRVHAGDGLVGLGECIPMLSLFNQTTEGVCSVLERHIGPAIVGRSPFDIEAIGVTVDRLFPAGGTIRAGIDLALHDLTGKILGVPVHDLVGGKLRNEIGVSAEVSTADPESTCASADLMRSLGFRSLKLKVGGDPYGDAACLRAVRDAVGEDIELRVDANQGWSLKEAVAFDRASAGCRLALMEQPLPRADIAGMAALTQSLEVQVAADEGLVSIEDACRIVMARASDLLLIKIGKNGGLTNCRTLAKFAHAMAMPVSIGTDFSLGVAIAAKLHLAASLPQLAGATEFSELGLFEEDLGRTLLCRGNFAIDNHSLRVPDAPGLGVDLDSDQIRDFPFKKR